MERKYILAGTVGALALLLPFGRWLLELRQNAADAKHSFEIERQFANRRAAPQLGQGGMWAGGVQNRSGRWRNGAGDSRAQPGVGRTQMMQAMAQEVGLTPSQVKQMQAIRASARPMMMDLFRNPQMSPEQKRAALQQVRAAQQAQISTILSADQQAKYATFQQKMRAQWQERMQQNGGRWTGGTER
jgi:hypothetical protein